MPRHFRRSIYAERMSTMEFPGSRKYVIYGNGRPQVFYSNHETVPKSSGKNKAVAIVVLLFFIFIGFFVIFSNFVPKKPIDMSYKDDAVIIDDTCDLLDDTRLIKDFFHTFQNKTGITPSLLVANPDVLLDSKFDNSSDYAEYEYSKRFSDDSHLLIVYFDDGSTDPVIEYARGSNTKDILTFDRLDQLSRSIWNKLGNGSTPEYAIADSFKDFTATIMISKQKSKDMTTGIFLIVFSVICGVLAFKSNDKRANALSKAIPCPPDAKEIQCPQCNGIYLDKTVLNCPYCNTRYVSQPKDVSHGDHVDHGVHEDHINDHRLFEHSASDFEKPYEKPTDSYSSSYDSGFDPYTSINTSSHYDEDDDEPKSIFGKSRSRYDDDEDEPKPFWSRHKTDDDE